MLTRMYGIMVLSLTVVSSCSLELPNKRIPLADNDNATSLEAATNIFDMNKLCRDETECDVIDQDCCGTGNFDAINKTKAMTTRAMKDAECSRALQKNKKLCEGKSRVVNSPTADCVDSQCVVSGGNKAPTGVQPLPPDDSCEADYQCQVVDQDCCGTGADVIAVNFSAGAQARRGVIKKCAELRKNDKNLCAGKRPMNFFQRKTAKCIKNKCSVS